MSCGLSLLIDCEELSAVMTELEKGSISGSKLFQMFLKSENIKAGVETWSVSALYDIRCRLHKTIMQMEKARAEYKGLVKGLYLSRRVIAN